MIWDRRFIDLAQLVSTWSKDPSTKIGVVLVDKERRVLGLGYNGFPRGVEDTAERLNDRPTKYKLVVHAEVNAILNCTHRPEGATLYMWPGGPPCNECAKAVIQAGIKRMVSARFKPERWSESCKIGGDMCTEAGIRIDFVEEK